MKIVQRLFTLSTFVIGITAASATPITGIVADAQTGEASMERLLRLRHDQPRHGKRLMIN